MREGFYPPLRPSYRRGSNSIQTRKRGFAPVTHTPPSSHWRDLSGWHESKNRIFTTSVFLNQQQEAQEKTEKLGEMLEIVQEDERLTKQQRKSLISQLKKASLNKLRQYQGDKKYVLSRIHDTRMTRKVLPFHLCVPSLIRCITHLYLDPFCFLNCIVFNHAYF